MTDTVRERELKFDVPDAFRLPDVGDVVRGSVLDHDTRTLRSVYFDTDDHALLTHRITLRRRHTEDGVPGDDEGWQLKIPAGAARDEIRLPPTDGDDVPAELAALVAGLIGRAALRPIATVTTRREATRVVRDGGLLVEIADDRVQAGSTTGTGEPRGWRELEIELGPAGDEDTLAAFARRAREGGAVASASASKLSRALGRVRDEPRSAASVAPADLLGGYLRDNLDGLVAGDIALRRGVGDVHRTRVAVRRIRSALRVFGSVLTDPGATAARAVDIRAVDTELLWYQGLLGAVRDRQVQRVHLIAAVHDLPPELVLGPVAARIQETLVADEAAASEALLAALRGNRYRRLLAAVTALADAPPTTPGSTVADLRRLADQAAGIARKRLRRGVRDGEDATLHRARKAAKRARYAAELTAPVTKHAKRTRRRWRTVQDVLGEQHDAVLAADLLRVLGAHAGTVESENGFTFGLLYERENARAARRRAEASRLRVPA